MRPLLRLLTVISFAAFVIAATLAFSVRAAPPGTVDAGTDAGASRTLMDLLGSTPDRAAMAGSKSFGASVTPPGFGSLGGLGSGGGELIRPLPKLVDVKVTGPLPADVVEHRVRERLGPQFGEEPCVFGTGDATATLDVAAVGGVRSIRFETDAGALLGLDCLSSRLGELTFPATKKPSTVTLTLHLERARVR